MLKIRNYIKCIRILVILMLANLFIVFSPCSVFAFDFEKIYKLSDFELSNIQGKYAGLYFSFDFSGYWDTAGSGSATLDYGGNLGDVVVGGTSPTITSGSNVILNSGDRAVRIQAMVGSINGTQGMIQISQVPGSNNVVTTVMNVQLTVINVNNAATAAKIFESLPFLAP
ncbi:MAG: hypothetical protein JRD93_06385 [Deltaproteobacteria bacterium]|nr:hypothetical protein [Deltaproteobacteria bacterium]MBW2661604.1 hypothetical protein [Deltaproteobacteria bacterium]